MDSRAVTVMIARRSTSLISATAAMARAATAMTATAHPHPNFYCILGIWASEHPYTVPAELVRAV
jgi:hypothetical protein